MTLRELIDDLFQKQEKLGGAFLDQPAIVDTVQQQTVSGWGLCGNPQKVILLLTEG